MSIEEFLKRWFDSRPLTKMLCAAELAREEAYRLESEAMNSIETILKSEPGR